MKFYRKKPKIESLEARRLLSTSPGWLDTSFAETGIAEFRLEHGTGLREDPTMLLPSSDGGHLVISQLETNDEERFTEIKKFTDRGRIDESFGAGGRVRLEIRSTHHNQDRVLDAVVQPDGKLLAAGYSSRSESMAWIQRFNVDGSVDVDFGQNGKIVNDDWFSFSSIALSDNSEIVAFAPSFGDGFITKYDATGRLIDTFGDGGAKRIRLEQSNYDVTVLENGSIIVAGGEEIYGFDAIGNVDRDFGLNGSIVVPVAINVGASLGTTMFVEAIDEGFIVASAGKDRQVTFVGRYHPDGRRYREFGDDGWLEIDGESPFFGRPHLAFEADGSFWFGEEGYPDRLLHFSSSGELRTPIIETPNVWGFGGLTVSETNLLTVFTDEIHSSPKLYSFSTSGAANHEFGSAGVTNVSRVLFHSDTRTIDLASGKSGQVYSLTRDTIHDRTYLYRLNNDGSIDNSFADEGRVNLTARVPVAFEEMTARRVFHGNDMTTVIFANRNQILVQRYNINGTLDPSFGFDGLAVLDLQMPTGTLAAHQDMVLEPDGGITLLVDMPHDDRRGYFVIQFDKNGTVQRFDDKDFKLVASLQPNGNESGKMCKVGDHYWMQLFSTERAGHNRSELTRYDDQFNAIPFADPIHPVLPNADDPPNVRRSRSSIACSPDRIILGGSKRVQEAGFDELQAYLPNGERDPSFGSNGIVRFEVFPETTSIVDLTIDAKGRIVAASHFREADDYGVVFHRLAPNGSPDSAFGSEGQLIVNGSPGLDSVNLVELETNGDVLFAGRSKLGIDSIGIVGRIIGDRNQIPAWQNQENALDVSRDQHVAPNDALAVINELNARGARLLAPYQLDATIDKFFDTNGDGWITPADAVAIINELNRRTAGTPSTVAAHSYASRVAWTDVAIRHDVAEILDANAWTGETNESEYDLKLINRPFDRDRSQAKGLL